MYIHPPSSHKGPVVQVGHLHRKPLDLRRFLHTPPFLHGFKLHGSTSVTMGDGGCDGDEMHCHSNGEVSDAV